MDFTDFWKRLRWADDDADRLSAHAKRYLGSDPYDFEVALDRDSGTVVATRTADADAEAEVLDECARLFGTYLDHTRAALNYLAYQIALTDDDADPSLNPLAVEFPIFNDSDLYRKANRVKKLSERNRLLFESLQPYQGGFDGLWILHELAQAHRHQILHVLGMAAINLDGSISVDGGSLTRFEVLDVGMLEGEASLIEFGFVRHESYVEIGTEVTFTIGIDHPLCVGRDAGTITNEITSSVARAIAGLVGAAGIPRRPIEGVSA